MKPTLSFIIPTLGREQGLQRCIDSIKNLNYPQSLVDIRVIDGEGTVPEKVARGVKETNGEYIIYGANDCEFTPESINEALKVNKALVAFNTGITKPGSGGTCEHFMIRRDFIPKIGGEIFCTRMRHCGVDNLLQAKAEKLGEFEQCLTAVVHHYHFSRGGEYDSIYDKGWSHVEEDRILLDKKLKEI